MTASHPFIQLVDGHFEGGNRPAEEQRLREHLPTCAQCRERYERRLLLAKLDPAASDASTRIARGLGWRRRPQLRWGGPALGLALACGLAVVVLRPSVTPLAPDDGFTARGKPARAPDALVVYAVATDGHIAPVGPRLRATDSLAFAYRNPDGHRYLLVFAVNEAGAVFWYYPRWSNASENPAAIPVARSTELKELPEAVAHPFGPGRVQIFGVLLDEPLPVREVEARLTSRGSKRIESLFPSGAQLQRVEMEVTP